MPIRFTCLNCKKTFEVEDKHGGKDSNCPTCKTPIKIPTAEPRKALGGDNVSKTNIKTPNIFTDEVLKRLARKYEQEEKARCSKAIEDTHEKIRKLEKEIDLFKKIQLENEDWAIKHKEEAAAGGYYDEIHQVYQPSWRCMQWAMDCVSTVREMGEKIKQTEREIARLHNTRYVPATKTPEQWVEEHYQSLLDAKRKASSENQYRDLAIEFREMQGYKGTAGMANECDNRYREMKAQREKEEADRPRFFPLSHVRGSLIGSA